MAVCLATCLLAGTAAEQVAAPVWTVTVETPVAARVEAVVAEAAMAAAAMAAAAMVAVAMVAAAVAAGNR